MAQGEWFLNRTIEQKAIKFIKEHRLLEPGAKVLVALSGGPDSVFALSFLLKYSTKYRITLGALHVNHSLRGAESDLDEEFCRELCGANNVEYFAFRFDIKKLAKERKASLEEAARDARYEVLKKTAVENNFSKIVTAHNLGDNAETVLLNLIKGTGIKGIAGIPVIRGNIIRPFLCLSKQEITAYLEKNNIPFRTDHTNNMNVYERNIIRHELLPVIKEKLNPSVEENLLNSSSIFRNAAEIISDYVSLALKDTVLFSEGALFISPEKLKKYTPALYGELLKEAFRLYMDREMIGSDAASFKMLLESQPGRIIKLAGGIKAVRERDLIVLRPEKEDLNEEGSEEIKIIPGDEFSFEGKRFKIILKENSVDAFTPERNTEFISADNLSEGEFVLRRWKPGDRFIPLGMKGFKKVSDFLTEQKIPAENRKKQLVLLNRNNIVWIPGLRIDERCKVSKNTKRIYQLCLE